MKPQKSWFALDNAAKLYPSIESNDRTGVFRLSVTLKKEVRPDLLQTALEYTYQRYPGFRVKLVPGLFWYVLDRNTQPPVIEKDVRNPCMRINRARNRGYLVKVRYFRRRIAVEFFHAITDGTGGITFLKTLTAEYLRLCGTPISCSHGVSSHNELPDPEELEDAFLKHYTSIKPRSRREESAFQIRSQCEPGHIYHVITGKIPIPDLKKVAESYRVTITELLVGIYIEALYDIQKLQKPRRRRPIKISVPINLRAIYPSRTLRNFALFLKPGIEPELGEYGFEEILKLVHHFMGYEKNEKRLAAVFSANVRDEKNLLMRIMPLFVKNMAISFVFNNLGENLFSGTLSNLGLIRVPEEMEPHIENFHFLLGPSRRIKTTCSVLGYDNYLYVNFGRVIQEPLVERRFFTRLVEMGVAVEVESNRRQ